MGVSGEGGLALSLGHGSPGVNNLSESALSDPKHLGRQWVTSFVHRSFSEGGLSFNFQQQ